MNSVKGRLIPYAIFLLLGGYLALSCSTVENKTERSNSTDLETREITSSVIYFADTASLQPDINIQPPCALLGPGKPYLDTTIPDGAIFYPGEEFRKTWRLKNLGSCTWDESYAVVWFSGDIMGNREIIYLPNDVVPGQSIDISIDMQAPFAPGIYQGNWMLRTPQGEFIGLGPAGVSPFWVRIEVVARYTSTNQPTATITPTPIVHITGSSKLFLAEVFNLDAGSARQPDEDLVFEKNNMAQLVITPLNGARFGKAVDEQPSMVTCMNGNLEIASIDVIQTQDQYFCYRTSQGLPGWIKIFQVDEEQNQMSFNYLTWSIP